MRRFLAVTIATMAIVAGCSFPKSAVPAPDSFPAPAGVPASDQSNVSPYPDLARLGLWNGTTFVSYGASFDYSPIVGGHVIVMTHGWAVGWLDTYENAQANSSTLVPFWDPAFTDPKTGELLSQNFLDLAASLQAADPTATILMYSWIDQSATPMSALAAYAPERATEVNGHRMATAIDSLLAPSFAQNGGQIHLIGHSFGANVATTAALSLREQPRQLTLFDSPEENLARFAGAKNDLRYKLPRLNIGRTAGTTFVDNYISEVGEEFHGYPGLEQVVDMRLAPPKSDNGGEKHEFPIGWYAGTVESLGSSAQQVGYAWSPLAGASDASVGAYWTQAANDGTTYTQVVGPPTPGVSSQLALDTTPLMVAADANGSSVTIPTGSVANIAFATTEDSLWLTYDLEQGPWAPQFDLYIDGRQRSTVVSGGARPGALAPGSFVILYDVSPGDHTLSVVSSGATFVGDTPCCPVTLSHLSIVSTTNIDRNLTPAQTRALVRWAIALLVLVIVLVLALLVWLTFVIARRIRRRRSGRRHAD